MKDKELAKLFENTFPNTLDTTIKTFSSEKGNESTFIITGDISAMWLRDSSNQVHGYIPYVTQDDHLNALIKGLINKMSELIIYDPYANAFTFDDMISEHLSDVSFRKGFLGTNVNAYTLKIFERKFEIDSLLGLLRLVNEFYFHSKNLKFFENNEKCLEAIKLIIDVLIKQQDDNDDYFFIRSSPNPYESLYAGKWKPFRKTGMIASAFRPSDDAQIFPFNIPQNMMAHVELQKLSNFLLTDLIVHGLDQFESVKIKAVKLLEDVYKGIKEFGTFEHPKYGKIYVYECDGYHSIYIIDEPNIPSLIGSAYLGYSKLDDEVYKNTRNFLLSKDNKYYFEIKNEEFGCTGSPHTGNDYIWPMCFIMRAFTSEDEEEIMKCLEILKKSAVDGFLHESFSVNSYDLFTRKWFAWVNGIFGELILHLEQTKPYLLFE